MSFRFIHTADLQIGKKFGQFPDNISSKLQDARFEIVKKIAELATKRNADAILVAGDCFDKISVSRETLARFKVKTEEFSGKWILLPGNHDYAGIESPWSRLKKLNLPDNIVIVDEAEPFMFDGKAVILPAPLKRNKELVDLTEWFDTCNTDKELIRVGLAHGSVTSFSRDEFTNPIAIDRCERAHLDYLALGDWHGHKKISEKIWYAGTPEPDRFRDNEPGYVLDVCLDYAGASPRVEPVKVAQYRWETKSIDVLSGDEVKKMSINKDYNDTILELELNGTVDLTRHATIEEDCDTLRARALHLDLVNKLCLEPSPSDFDALNISGFIGTAIDKLKKIKSEPAKIDDKIAIANPEKIQRQLTKAEVTENKLKKRESELKEQENRISERLSIADGTGELLEKACGAHERAKAHLEHVQLEAEAWKLLVETLDEAEQEAKASFVEPILECIEPFLSILFPQSQTIIDEKTVEIKELHRGDQKEPFHSLSIGTREQLSILVRLAFAKYLKEKGYPSMVILDDALVYADDGRFERMQHALREAGKSVQIIILTCRARDWQQSGFPVRNLADVLRTSD